MASRSIKNRPGIKKKHPSIGFLAVFTVFLAVIVAGFSGVYALGSSWIGDLEDYDVSDAGQLNSSLPSIMLASDGTELARFQVELGPLHANDLAGAAACQQLRAKGRGVARRHVAVAIGQRPERPQLVGTLE